jgi:signal transduction histidine kinase
MLAVEIERTEADIEIQNPLPTIKANRTLLVQIFSNLIGNAIKFARKGEPPKIQVFAELEGEICHIHVKDFGVGIAEQYHQSIFKMFERANIDAETSGTGIGLAVVKRAVERLGGKISLKSAPGEGSEFIVQIGCAPSSPASALVQE